MIFISQPFYPDQQATSQLLSALAQALSAPTDQKENVEFEVSALCSRPSLARGVEQTTPKRERWGEVEIYRGGLSIDAKKSLFHRALSYGSFLLWLSWRLLFYVKKEDRVLVVTNPPFAPILTAFCSNIRSLIGTRLNYSVILHDLYPDGLIALGKLKSSWWVTLWQVLNRSALKNANTVITLGRDMSNYCRHVYGLDERKLTVITNWSPIHFKEDELLSPSETKLSTRLPEGVIKEDHLIIQYSGNMGLWHNMNGIVDAAAELRDLPIHFLMIGDGRRREEAVKHAEQLQLDNITWLPFQPLETLSDSLSCAHLSLVSQRDALLGIMVPSKFYGILASGRAVIAQVPANSEVALTIEEYQCGIVLTGDEGSQLASSLRDLYQNRLLIEQMGRQAREAYLSRFSFESAVSAFRSHLSVVEDHKEIL